jgi:hypothetical protein
VLTAADALNELKVQYDRTIDVLGVPMMWAEAKSAATAPLVAGLRIASDTESTIVQAYGVGARIITIKAASLTQAPVKFDRFIMGGEVMVAEHVAPVHLAGTLVGYRVYVRGR